MGFLARRAQLVPRDGREELSGAAWHRAEWQVGMAEWQVVASSPHSDTASVALQETGTSQIYYDDGETQTIDISDEEVAADRKSALPLTSFRQSCQDATRSDARARFPEVQGHQYDATDESSFARRVTSETVHILFPAFFRPLRRRPGHESEPRRRAARL